MNPERLKEQSPNRYAAFEDDLKKRREQQADSDLEMAEGAPDLEHQDDSEIIRHGNRIEIRQGTTRIYGRIKG